jgi:hypothetical protein
LLQANYSDDEAAAFSVYDDLSDTPDEEDIENESEEEEDDDVSGKVCGVLLLSRLLDYRQVSGSK